MEDLIKLMAMLDSEKAIEVLDDEKSLDAKVLVSLLSADDSKVCELASIVYGLMDMRDFSTFEKFSFAGTMMPQFAREYAEDYSKEEVLSTVSRILKSIYETIEETLDEDGENNECCDGNCGCE